MTEATIITLLGIFALTLIGLVAIAKTPEQNRLVSEAIKSMTQVMQRLYGQHDPKETPEQKKSQ